MPPFSVYCVYWLLREFRVAQKGVVSPLLEKLGVASYSIYLTHKIVLFAVDGAGIDWRFAWALDLVGVALLTLVFYLAVERPAHLASMMVGRRIKAMRLYQASATA